MFGFLNVYKPKGKTSHDVILILRKVTGIKQIGHTGTLDPLAEGVLPICIGKSTRLIEYLKDDKAYTGVISLGKSTATFDAEGQVVNTSSKKASIEEIEAVLPYFRDEIEQLPPVYSAVKVNGKKLYDYARKGEEIELKPRKARIYEIEILNFDFPKQELKLHISCSKGTYIRSIADDLGKKLGTYGYLSQLIRTKAGCFEADKSVRLEDLNTKEKVKENLINPLDCLDLPRYQLDEDEFKKVSCGMSIINKHGAQRLSGTVLLMKESEITAISQSENGILRCLKVFV